MHKMLEIDELMEVLTHLPKYNKSIRLQQATKRLIALEDCMLQIYIPNQMAYEVYSRMYLATYKAEQKKNTVSATKQYYENFKVARSLTSSRRGGILGGSQVSTLIGESGIGKTTAIQKAVALLNDDNEKYINVLQVQCPNDCSIKGLLLNILQEIDNITGSDYFLQAIKSKYTTDMLIGVVSIACQNYLNMLIIDEIQNIRLNMKVRSGTSNGEKFIAALVQIINCTGISLLLVGTPDIEPVFQKELHLARRSIGLHYEALPYDDEFCSFCETIYNYQFTRKAEPFSEKTSLWLYQHTGGKIALIIGLIETAQEIAIINGTDCLDIDALERAYEERYKNIDAFIKKEATVQELKPKLQKARSSTTANSVARIKSSTTNCSSTISIKGIVDFCKKNKKNIIEELRPHITIVEVQI